MSDRKINRRDFLKTAAAVSAAPAVLSIVPRHVLGLGQTPPSDKLNVAGIGIGGKGADDLHELETENIVALCDVDPNYAAETIAKYPTAKFYTDYRVMLEKQKDIDAVVIATPDHTHAVITLAAMQLGQHVYTQKPLTHSVFEARALARAAAESKVTTQMGIQGHSGEGMRLISEWIQAGLICEVTEVEGNAVRFKRVAGGIYLKAGDRIGHPSCEGGVSNGTHVHLARRYNGEWIPADQVNSGNALPFIMDGWVSSGNGLEYDGYLERDGESIEAWEGYYPANTIHR